MTTRCTPRSLAMIAGAMLAFATLFTLGASTAEAACANINIINNTTCVVKVYVVCTGLPATLYTVPAMSSVVAPIPAGCNPQIVPIICGNRRNLPPGCINNVDVGGCCANVCYSITACFVRFDPVPGPCPCP